MRGNFSPLFKTSSVTCMPWLTLLALHSSRSSSSPSWLSLELFSSPTGDALLISKGKCLARRTPEEHETINSAGWCFFFLNCELVFRWQIQKQVHIFHRSICIISLCDEWLSLAPSLMHEKSFDVWRITSASSTTQVLPCSCVECYVFVWQSSI